MAIMLNPSPNVYEHIFFSASQPPDSSTLLQPAGIADGSSRRLTFASDVAGTMFAEPPSYNSVRRMVASPSVSGIPA